ncbi:hypothetical protein APSETT444_009318 [Aspergillus pseudonomiae]|uniref:Beta/gamma crystallin 'Greek key' domain-containing protein n=1 Tax=Aspergillus nomiae NRRL (strain ATCC 15546 / NRRL 13137 / CBS 260.88 / M93) TaxID=1509407 RepID=A0A0L1JDJ1_ASPN3|nr:uncharacterized protein ANOM_002271 [Aspergillus nomiae NRRL 13137]KNG89463.1 hypothetical protein ANOM_002271 [Aspergillus nomiae NRRL 13137]
MFKLGTAIVTALGLLMAGVASGAPAEPVSTMENPTVTIYQDMMYRGNSEGLREANVCYSFPANTPWFHNISSMNIRDGYTCDAYMGFDCNQMLRQGLQGEYRNLDIDGMNNIIESMRCRPI